MRKLIYALSILALSTLGVVPAVNLAQVDCGIAESFAYPVDMSEYMLMQGFGVPSPRHQGRYHTGEDYARPDGDSLGRTVYAIGRGVVTYSYSLGWGRDAGVVIVRHTMADGAQWISLYGHITPSDSVPFPLIGTCVEQGQAIGTIADVRPAPHVHLELRLAMPDMPGAGYSWLYPDADAPQWRAPGRILEAYR